MKTMKKNASTIRPAACCAAILFTLCLGSCENSLAPIVKSIVDAYNHPPGSLDASFASGGAYVDPNADTAAYAVAIDGSGRILATGSRESAGAKRHELWRFSADGKVDAAFHTAYAANLAISAIEGESTSLLLAGSSIVMGGCKASISSPSNIRVLRVLENGSLDTAFNGGIGKEFPPGTCIPPTGIFALTEQAGNYIAAGYGDFGEGQNPSDFFIVRYLGSGPNAGELDSTFGSSGRAQYDFYDIAGLSGKSTEHATSIGTQSNGKIIVAGYSQWNHQSSVKNDFALIRLNTNGSRDATFNTNLGYVITDFLGGDANCDDQAYTLAIQNDDKIILAGESKDNGGTEPRIAIARYTADGTLDTSFGTNGKAIMTFASSKEQYIKAMRLLPNGKILLAGSIHVPGDAVPSTRWLIVRLNTDGSLDTAFNGTGYLTLTPHGLFGSANAVALQSDGKALIAGTVFDAGGKPHAAIIRIYQ